MRIREAGGGDLEVATRLLGAQLEEHALGTGDQSEAVRGAMVRPHRGAILIAEEEDGRAVGVAYIGWFWSVEHGGASAWLDELYVVPERRGHGVGTRLLEAVIALAAERGAVAVDLEVDASHARAEHLYARRGFMSLPRRRWVLRLEGRPAAPERRPLPHVILRPLAASDQDALLSLARESVEHTHPWARPASTPEAFARALDRTRRDDYRSWVVALPDGRIAGAMNLSHIAPEPFNNAVLGYWCGARFAGGGLMSAALRLLLNEAFGTLALHRVEASVQPGNEKSRALLHRGGFRLEGFSPRFLFLDGAWRDHERWAITREDPRP